MTGFLGAAKKPSLSRAACPLSPIEAKANVYLNAALVQGLPSSQRRNAE